MIQKYGKIRGNAIRYPAIFTSPGWNRREIPNC